MRRVRPSRNTRPKQRDVCGSGRRIWAIFNASSMNMNTYVPRSRLKGGHRMTLYTWSRPRSFPRLPQAESRYFDVASDARVLAHCHWQPQTRSHPTLVALHGLEASSHAHYMLGLADKAFSRGFNVVRLNQRNCGGTEHLSAGLYHSGLSADPAAVIRELIELDGLGSIAVVGYSLGGNVALKLAGDYGERGAPAAHVDLRGVADDGSGSMRRRARAAGKYPIRVELRSQPEASNATESTRAARAFRSQSPSSGADGPRVRRDVHRTPTTAFSTPTITTIGRAACEWSTASACRH